jgi:hypothetical protein
MSANLLVLNSSKTDFLLMGLHKQLSKVDIPSLFVDRKALYLLLLHAARYLDNQFDCKLSLFDQISSIKKFCLM